jgi:hypothetical protein
VEGGAWQLTIVRKGGRECVITVTYIHAEFPGDLFPFPGDKTNPSNPVFSYTPLPLVAEPYVPLPFPPSLLPPP